ncbi:MAG TPA: hypothetical protein EYP03_02840 [Aquificae bacterium]|nr:hypothetical protein [Aquificota bacterium]
MIETCIRNDFFSNIFSICAKMIINAQIKEIVYLNYYPDKMSLKLFEKAKITLRKISGDENNEK